MTDESLDERLEKFGVQIDDKYAYRIPLKCFCDLGKINFPTKIDLKIRCTLETDMKIFFESKKVLKPLKLGATSGSATATDYAPVTSPGVPDETIMLSSKVLRMGIQKTPYQKTYELQSCSQEFTVDFNGCD